MVESFRQFLTQASARGARSTALQPLGWALVIILGALPACLWAHAPDWLLIGIGLSAAVIVLIYVGSYLFLLVVDRDALRSESFALSKLAISKGLVGDNLSGMREPEALESSPKPMIAVDGKDS